MNVKFLWNGIKVDGKLYRAWYSDGKTINNSAGTISIYGKDYISFPKIEGLTIKNDSDDMTDYFCNDVIRVAPDNEHYADVMAAVKAVEERKARKILPREVDGPVDKLQAFAAAVEAAELAALVARDVDCESNRRGVKVTIKPGKKYTKVDVGSSGRFMIDQEGNIFGIKGYGVVNFGHNYGTLDNPVIRTRY